MRKITEPRAAVSRGYWARGSRSGAPFLFSKERDHLVLGTALGIFQQTHFWGSCWEPLEVNSWPIWLMLVGTWACLASLSAKPFLLCPHSRQLLCSPVISLLWCLRERSNSPGSMKQQPVGSLPGYFTVHAGCFPKGAGVRLQAERKDLPCLCCILCFSLSGPPTHYSATSLAGPLLERRSLLSLCWDGQFSDPYGLAAC